MRARTFHKERGCLDRHNDGIVGRAVATPSVRVGGVEPAGMSMRTGRQKGVAMDRIVEL